MRMKMMSRTDVSLSCEERDERSIMTADPKDGESGRDRERDDAHCVPLQSIADVLRTFLPDLIAP